MTTPPFSRPCDPHRCPIFSRPVCVPVPVTQPPKCDPHRLPYRSVCVPVLSLQPPVRSPPLPHRFVCVSISAFPIQACYTLHLASCICGRAQVHRP